MDLYNLLAQFCKLQEDMVSYTIPLNVMFTSPLSIHKDSDKWLWVQQTH